VIGKNARRIINQIEIFWQHGLKKDLIWKKVYGWNLSWPKLKELIKFKDLIKFLMSLIDLIKYLIKAKIKFKS